MRIVILYLIYKYKTMLNLYILDNQNYAKNTKYLDIISVNLSKKKNEWQNIKFNNSNLITLLKISETVALI